MVTIHTKLLVSTMIAVTFTLASCSKSSTSQDTTNKNKTTENKQQATEQTLRRGNSSEPQSVDPQLVTGYTGITIQKDLFEGLLMEDAKGKIVPGIAKSWEISEDGKIYTFTLRETTWTNGEKLTAHDVVFALQRAVDPKVGSDYSFMLYPIKNAKKISKSKESDLNKLGVKAISDYTVEITLENQTPYFLSILTHPLTYPVPQSVVKKHGKNWTKKENIVSNGAFKMVDWKPQSSIDLVKSTTYWDKDAVTLDKVIFYPIEDENSEFKRFRAGEIDMTTSVPAEQLKVIKEKYPNQYKVNADLAVYYYGLNTTKEPFKDNLALRKALAYAIDRNKITQKILGKGEKPAYNVVVSGVNNAKPYQPAYAKLSQQERNTKAKEFYKEAGYSTYKPLKLDVLYNIKGEHKKIAVAIASMWKETLGVNVNLINQEWKVYLETRKNMDTQAFRAGWGGDYNDPNTFLEMWQSKAGLNDVGFASQTFDNLLDKAAKEQDLTARADILAQAEQELIDDFSVLPIYFYVNNQLVADRVQGVESNVMNVHPSKYISLSE